MGKRRVRLGFVQQRLADTFDQPRLALNAPLQLAKLIQGHMVWLDGGINGQIVILLHRTVHVDVHLEIRLTHGRLFVLLHFLGRRPEDGQQDRKDTKRYKNKKESYAFHRVGRAQSAVPSGLRTRYPIRWEEAEDLREHQSDPTGSYAPVKLRMGPIARW